MESLPKDKILKFRPDTLSEVREIFDLHKPGAMDEAVDILDVWVKQQNHFLKKDFSRDYLERAIINSKGSVERAKLRLDKSCTFRTLMPHFYINFDVKNDFKHLFHKTYVHAALPTLTSDNYRVFFIKLCRVPEDTKTILEYYKLLITFFEYLRAHDYANGYIYVADLTNINILEISTRMSLIDLRQLVTLIIEGYGVRIKGIHFLSESKLIDTMIAIMKQVLSAKIVGRIAVHKNLESLHKLVPKKLLPKDYGGEETSLGELHDEWVDALSTEDFKKYLEAMSKAGTNEKYRPTDNFNDQYMGMPGTFRTLSVD